MFNDPRDPSRLASSSADSEQTEEQEPRVPLGWLAATGLYAALGLTAIVALLVFCILGQPATLYHSTADGWEKVTHKLPGSLNMLATTDNGTLWLRTTFRGSLTRFDGEKWESFRGPQFGTKTNYPFVGFALTGEECWTAVDEQLLHYVNGTWEHPAQLPPGAKQDKFRAIAADADGAWLLRKSQLWRFSDGQWNQEDLSVTFPNVPKRGPGSWQEAKIQVTGDGALWLVAGNVWRREPGNPWQAVTAGDRPLEFAELLGVGPERVWFAENTDLIWVSLDRNQHGVYTAAEMGRDPEDPLRYVADNTRRNRLPQEGEKFTPEILVGTQTHVYRLEPELLAGNIWSEVPQFTPKSRVAGLAVTPTGQQWFAETGPFNFLPIWIASGLLTFCSLLGTFLVWKNLWGTFEKPMLKSGRVFLVTLAVIVAQMFMLAPAEGRDPQLAWAFWPLMATVLLLTLPVLLVLLRWMQVRSSRVLEQVSFQKLREQDLPPAVQQYFREQSPALEALGFRYLADYRLKQKVPRYVRVLLSDDGCTYSEVVHERHTFFLNTKAITFINIFENGVYFESTNFALSKNRDDGLFLTLGMRGATADQLLAAHREKAAWVMASQETHLVPVVHEHYPMVVTYGYKLLYDVLVSENVVTENPYADAATPKILTGPETPTGAAEGKSSATTS